MSMLDSVHVPSPKFSAEIDHPGSINENDSRLLQMEVDQQDQYIGTKMEKKARFAAWNIKSNIWIGRECFFCSKVFSQDVLEAVFVYVFVFQKITKPNFLKVWNSARTSRRVRKPPEVQLRARFFGGNFRIGPDWIPRQAVVFCFFSAKFSNCSICVSCGWIFRWHSQRMWCQINGSDRVQFILLKYGFWRS